VPFPNRRQGIGIGYNKSEIAERGRRVLSVAKGWKKQKSVLVALFLRELKARFTSGQGGLFWTFFQPFFMVVIFLLMHLFIRGSSADAESAKHEAIFLTVGFVPFFLFRNLLNGSAGAIRANRNLFVYRHVKPIDTIMARVMVETFIYSIIIIIFIFAGLYFGVDIVPKNLVMVNIPYISFQLFGTCIL
jgi:capsular polysaccharide transport system permease protein